MYQNQYSEGVSNEYDRMIRDYIHNSDRTNSNFDGSNMYGGRMSNANNCQCMQAPCRCYKGEDSTVSLSGGSGFAAGTRLDSGFERTIGAGIGSKVYKKGKGQVAGMPPPENLNEYPQVGVAGPDNLSKAVVKRVVGGKKGSGLQEIKDDLKKADLNRIKQYIGLGKKGKGMKEIKEDLKKADLNRIKDYVGLGMNQAQLARLPPKNIDKVVEKNQMQGIIGGGMSGGVKKRAELVKKIMAEKGLSMINASKYVKEKGLYKK
jgi:hypothetical protein